MESERSLGASPHDDLDLADVQRDQILDELRAIKLQTKGPRFLAGLLMSLLVAVLWFAAELHDSNCYAQAELLKLKELTDGREFPKYALEADCTLLPWNPGIED